MNAWSDIFNIKKTLTVSAARILLIVVSAAVILVACNDPAPVAEEVDSRSTSNPDLLGYAAEIGIAMLDWLAEQARWRSSRGTFQTCPYTSDAPSGSGAAQLGTSPDRCNCKHEGCNLTP